MLAIALVCAAAPVAAQDSRAELARRELLSRAEAARARGDHAEALTLGAQALELRATPSLRLLLAQEHRAIDHHVDAFDQATACVREADADPSLRNRELILRECRALVAAVEPRIARLVVRVTPRGAPGLQVRVGESELPTALLGVPMPTMPGAVTVLVRATGMSEERRELTLRAGAEETVAITLAAPAPPPTSTPPAPSVDPVTVPQPSPSPIPVSSRAPESVSSGNPRRLLGWLSLGAGVVGLGVGIGGAVMRGAALNAYDTEELPGGGGCPGASFNGTQPAPCQEHLDQGALGSALQWGGFIGGGVLGITGAVLLLTAGPSRETPHASLRCGSMGLGLHCAGTF